MVNPKDVVDAVVTTLQGTTAFAAAMPGGISAHRFNYGLDHSLQQAIWQMPAATTLVAWVGTQPGPFGGMVTWKTSIAIYLRMANAAGQAQPVGYEDLWTLIANAFSSIELIPGKTQIIDLPGIEHLTDENGVDYFCVHMVVPQIGDLT